MFILLALLGRFAALLPQSWRAHAEQKLIRHIQNCISSASPRDAAYLLALCDALICAAETREERWAAISFEHCTQNTLADRDRSGHFNRHKPRRMRFTRRRERARTIRTPFYTPQPRALDLSG